MSTTHGNDGKVYIGANQVAEINDFTLNESIDTVDASSMGASYRKYVTGLKDWDASVNCWWDETDTNGQEAMTLGATVTLNLYPEGNASSDTYATMSGIIESIGVSASKDGIVTRSFTIKPADQNGVTWGTVA